MPRPSKTQGRATRRSASSQHGKFQRTQLQCFLYKDREEAARTALGLIRIATQGTLAASPLWEFIESRVRGGVRRIDDGEA